MIKIKEMREQRGITQVELAQKLSVQQSAIAAWETGKSMPRAERFVRLAEILNCSVDELLGKTKQKTKRAQQ